MNSFSQLLDVVNRPIVRQGVNDGWKWKQKADGRYSTSSAYVAMYNTQAAGQHVGVNGVAFQLVCNKLAPLKVSVLAWRLLRDRLPTKTNLVKRRVALSEADRKCCFCGLYDEDAGHVFFHCSSIYDIWRECYAWLGVPTVLHQSPLENFLIHDGILSGKRGNFLAICIWECLVWSIWKLRNNVIFKGKEANTVLLLDEVKGRVWSWGLTKNFIHCNFPLREWLNDARSVL